MERSLRNSSIAIFLAVVCFPLLLSAQQLDAYKKKYPDDKLVYLRVQETAVISYNKEGGLTIQETAEEEVYYLDASAANFSERHIAFSELNKLKKYEAYSMIPVGGKMVKKPVTEYKFVDKYETDNFHDDLKAYIFFFPSLSAGATSYMSYQTEVTEPYLYGSFSFCRGAPVEKAVYSVTFPSDLELQVQPYNCEKLDLKVDTLHKKGQTTLTFQLNDVTKLPSESGAPSLKNYCPSLLISIASYAHNGSRKRMLKDVSDLAGWYCSLMKKVDNRMPEALKTICDSIKSRYTEQEDQVKAVYYWAQDNISYISIQEGMGGFIPADVQSCFSQRYGDCKAMSNLMHQMLRYMQIPAYLGLVGTRDIPYSYRETPGSFIDNHMIAMYRSPANGWQILDATGRYVPYGSIPTAVQGKEILIVKEDCSYEIYDVPLTSLEVNYSTDSLSVRLEDNLVKGKGKENYGGDDNIRLNIILSNQDKDRREKFLINYFRRGGNKCTVKNTRIHHLNDRSRELEMEYEIEIRDYAFFEDGEIIFNPHLKRALSSTQIDTSTRKLDIEYEHLGVFVFDLTIEIPEGYRVEYLPASQNFEHDHTDVSLVYEQSGNNIHFRSRVSTKKLLLKKDQYKAWNEMISKLNKAYNETIVLKKNI